MKVRVIRTKDAKYLREKITESDANLILCVGIPDDLHIIRNRKVGIYFVASDNEDWDTLERMENDKAFRYYKIRNGFYYIPQGHKIVQNGLGIVAFGRTYSNYYYWRKHDELVGDNRKYYTKYDLDIILQNIRTANLVVTFDPFLHKNKKTNRMNGSYVISDIIRMTKPSFHVFCSDEDYFIEASDDEKNVNRIALSENSFVDIVL